MASTDALGIPEILAHVLQALRSCADIARCCRVSRLWYDTAISRLWETAPSCSTLIGLHVYGSLKKYLPYIKKQAIDIRDEQRATLIQYGNLLRVAAVAPSQIVALSLVFPSSFDPTKYLNGILRPSLRILQLPRSCRPIEKIFTCVEVSFQALLLEQDMVRDTNHALQTRAASLQDHH